MSEDRSQEPSNIPGLTNEQRWKIRDFSKDRYPSDRQNTRQAVNSEIRGIRKERQDVKAREQASTRRKGELIDTRQAILVQKDTLVEKLTIAEAELRAREASLVLQVVDFVTRGEKNKN